MLLTLLLSACTPLSGDWEGEVDCGDYAMDVNVTLEWTGQRYEGVGSLDCTDGYGSRCEESFEIQVDPEHPLGAGGLDVDLDECHAAVEGYASDVSCDNPDDVQWDGGGAIEGEWADCELELFRSQALP